MSQVIDLDAWLTTAVAPSSEITGDIDDAEAEAIVAPIPALPLERRRRPLPLRSPDYRPAFDVLS